MNNKVAVITGASSGLGASVTQRLSALGYHVCLLGRNEKKIKAVAESLYNEDYSIHLLDVSDNKEVENVFNIIKNTVGDVSILFNNAGMGAFDLLEDIEENDINKMIDVNLKGTIYCTQQIITSMKKNNEGTIANVISTAGLEGKVNETVYCASKFGVRGFTEGLLAELKDTKIQVFGAYMGGMRTDFWNDILTEEQTKHLMDPNDVADIIVNNIKKRDKLNVEQVVIKNH